jgi:hypothetical protein
VTAATRDARSEMRDTTSVEPREFTFHWRENGQIERWTCYADCYEDACWMLGAFHLLRFRKNGVPPDFELDLVSQEPR